jgi:hypothetical protein
VSVIEHARITVTSDEDRVVADIRGSLPALLELEDELYNRGPGSQKALKDIFAGGTELLKKHAETPGERGRESANWAQERKRAEMDQARMELENIKLAIRQGVVTATRRQMLEETEARVSSLTQGVEDSCFGRP